MENSNEKVSNKNLEEVSGGFSGVKNSCSTPSSLHVTQEEYDCLVDGGYIVDGKCSWRKLEEIGNYLNGKGYKGRIFHTGHREPGEKLCTDVKITINKEVSDENLNKVSGGAKFDHEVPYGNTTLGFTDEEYKCLVDGGYIVDGKMDKKTVRLYDAIEYLEKKGVASKTPCVGKDISVAMPKKSIHAVLKSIRQSID